MRLLNKIKPRLLKRILLSCEYVYMYLHHSKRIMNWGSHFLTWRLFHELFCRESDLYLYVCDEMMEASISQFNDFSDFCSSTVPALLDEGHGEQEEVLR